MAAIAALCVAIVAASVGGPTITRGVGVPAEGDGSASRLHAGSSMLSEAKTQHWAGSAMDWARSAMGCFIDCNSMHTAGRIIKAMPLARYCTAVSSLLLVLIAGACSKTASPPPALPISVTTADPVVRGAVELAWDNASTSPQSAQARLTLALLLDANGFDDAAANAWEAMAALAPSDGRPHYFLALQAAEQNDLQRAIESMKRVHALSPKHVPALWRAGYWQLDLGKALDARSLFEQAIAADPSTAAAAIGLARADLALGNTDSAIEQLRTLRQQTGHPYVVYLLGQALRRGGLGDEAAALPIEGTPSVPSYGDAWNVQLLDAQRGLDAELGRAERLLEGNQLNEALLAVQRALMTWPDNVLLLNTLGEVHRHRNDMAKWVHTLERAGRLDPKSFQTQLNLSMALRASGDGPRAMRAAMAATTLQPDVPDGHLQVARMHLLAKRPAEAVEALELAFARGVVDPREHVQFASALLQVGRAADAIDRLNAILKKTPTLPNGWILLTSIHDRAGRQDVALQAASAGLARNPQDQSLQRIVVDLEGRMARPSTPETDS
jgi:predicted Zn-dependent protease